MGKSATNLRQD